MMNGLNGLSGLNGLNGETLFDVIGEIDEGFVAQAHAYRHMRGKLSRRGAFAAVACLLLAAGTFFPFVRYVVKGGDCPLAWLPGLQEKCSPPEPDNQEKLPLLRWKQNGKNGDSLVESTDPFVYNGAYYEALNMADDALLERDHLPRVIYDSDVGEKVAEVSTDSGRKMTLYEYIANQQALYIAECGGAYTFAVFCNRVRADLSRYDTAGELFAIYGIEDAGDIMAVEIGERRLEKPGEIQTFYDALCSAQGMGNVQWNTAVFSGLSEKQSQTLCTELADTAQEVTVISTRGLRAHMSYYPTVGYVEWAINYYRLRQPL